MDGTDAYLFGDGGEVYRYRLRVPWDLSTAVLVEDEDDGSG